MTKADNTTLWGLYRQHRETLKELLDQLEAVGIYIRGQDEGQWEGTEGLSFAQAERILQP